ncbi:MAG: hypothetical protein Q9160_002990 [Pyrenula sp. 1 TL-2023]
MRRCFTTAARCSSHENPLGLPRRGQSQPPSIPRAQRGLPQKRKIRDVAKTIAVSSAKGGVGKSTIAVNLALTYSRLGLRTGILDTDIFGPSIPTLLNLHDASEPRLSDRNTLIPLTNYGLKSMSMGYLLPSEKAPVAWRGLMVMKALQQLLHEVEWGGLDVLVLDLPPGTGDVQLTIGQQMELDGAVVVSTPQDVALKDAVKGVGMFDKMGVKVLGMIQNMSGFVCPGCGRTANIFSPNGEMVKHRCEELGVRFLGSIPLQEQICEDSDRGVPSVVAEEMKEQNGVTASFKAIAKEISQQVDVGREVMTA